MKKTPVERYHNKIIFFMSEPVIVDKVRKSLTNKKLKITKNGKTKTMTYSQYYQQSGG